MVKEDDIEITRYWPNIESNKVISIDIEYLLFGTITCNSTIYKDIPFNDVHKEVLDYINSKLKP